MNFKTFLESTEQFDIDKFMSDCKYFFQEREFSPFFLFHGSMKKSMPKDFTVTTQIERTGPRDSIRLLHDSVNEVFKERFGYPFRNGMFATGSFNQANGFGDVYCIFPIGHFEWLGSDNLELRDLTFYYNDVRNKIARKHGSKADNDRELAKEIENEAVSKIADEIKNSNDFFYNESLNKCLNNGGEIMLKMDKIYLVNYDGPTMRKIHKALDLG